MEFVRPKGKKMKYKSISYFFAETFGSSDSLFFWGAGILSFLRRLLFNFVFDRLVGYNRTDIGERLHKLMGVIFDEDVSDIVSVGPKDSFAAIYASNFI